MVPIEERTSCRIVHLPHLRLTGNNESKNPLRGLIERTKVMTTVTPTQKWVMISKILR
jgi:hypothetical protein